MYEKSNGKKMVHGRLIVRGLETVLGNAAKDREVFLTNDCLEFELNEIRETVVVESCMRPWGYQHRKANAKMDKADEERAEERKRRGLPMEFYCKSLYWPEKGAFFCLPKETMGLGTGDCHSCKLKETQREDTMKLHSSLTSFTYRGTDYSVNDCVYLSPHHFGTDERGIETFKGGKNVGLNAYVVCQLLGIESPKGSKQPCPISTMVKVRRFFRPEDISVEKAYCSDIREVSNFSRIIKFGFAWDYIFIRNLMYSCLAFGTLFFLFTGLWNLACFPLLTSVCGLLSLLLIFVALAILFSCTTVMKQQ